MSIRCRASIIFLTNVRHLFLRQCSSCSYSMILLIVLQFATYCYEVVLSSAPLYSFIYLFVAFCRNIHDHWWCLIFQLVLLADQDSAAELTVIYWKEKSWNFTQERSKQKKANKSSLMLKHICIILIKKFLTLIGVFQFREITYDMSTSEAIHFEQISDSR